MFVETLKFQRVDVHGPSASVWQLPLAGGNVLLVFGANARTAVIVPADMVPYPDRDPTDEELDALTAEALERWVDGREEKKDV